jgi:hypothetical protein
VADLWREAYDLLRRANSWTDAFLPNARGGTQRE